MVSAWAVHCDNREHRFGGQFGAPNHLIVVKSKSFEGKCFLWAVTKPPARLKGALSGNGGELASLVGRLTPKMLVFCAEGAINPRKDARSTLNQRPAGVSTRPSGSPFKAEKRGLGGLSVSSYLSKWAFDSLDRISFGSLVFVSFPIRLDS